MKQLRSQFLVLFLCCIVFFVGGCSKNLFVDLDKDQTAGLVSQAEHVGSDSEASSVVSDLNESLKDAIEISQYENLKKAAQALIDNPNVSDSVKDDARLVLAQASMGVLELTPLDVAANILDTLSGDTNELNAQDFVDKLQLSDKATSEDVRSLVHEFDLISPSKLSSANYLQKAVATTIVVVDAIQQVYDLDTGEFFGPANESLSQLVSVDAYDKNILDYTVDSIDAYQKSGALSTGNDGASDLDQGLDNFKESVVQINALNDAVQSGGTYTYNSEVYDFSDESVDYDAQIEAAFSAILNGDANH